MNEFDYFIFNENNKPEGSSLWFFIKVKDLEGINQLIEDNFIPAMFEKMRLALKTECFSEANHLKDKIIDKLEGIGNTQLVVDAKKELDKMIEQYSKDYIII